MRILYLGSSNNITTSWYRAKALERIGHQVIVIDPYEFIDLNSRPYIFRFVHYRTGYKFLQKKIAEWVHNKLIHQAAVDLVWVDSGELIGKTIVQNIKKLGLPIVLFNHDDPTGKRDGNRFKSLKEALPFYTVVTAVRQETENELIELGANKVIRIWRSYDEVMHNSNLVKGPIESQYQSDVSFIGTWMRGEGRDEFLLQLIKRGISIAIWGSRWNKSKYWQELYPYWRGDSLGGSDYVKAILGAKICLGFLSTGNRDLHTTRTMEIPFAGGLFCAKRTSDHLSLYRDGIEAVFWDDINECYEKCKLLIDNPQKREAIRLAGHQRVLNNNVGNEAICKSILSAITV